MDISKTIIDERQMLRLIMRADPKNTKDGGMKLRQARNEIIEIVRAWHRGELLLRSETPLLSELYRRGHDREYYGDEFRPLRPDDDGAPA